MTEAAANETPSPRILRRQERTRQAILAAATECFNNKSVATVSVEEITAAADISRGTFYKLFPHKEEVFLQIARPMLELYSTELARIECTGPREVFDRILGVYIRVWREQPEAFSLASRESRNVFHLLEDMHRPAMHHMRRLFSYLERYEILRVGRADFAVALLARSAVIVLRTFDHDPEWESLFRDSMSGFLLKDQHGRS